MRRLVEAFGADFEQWRALTIMGIKLDLRHRRLGAQKQHSRRRLNLPPGMVIYFFIGLVFAGMMASFHNVLLGAILLASYAMFMTGTTVLLEYHTVVTAPDDYFILGYQPISSRTYFAARITNLLVFVLFTTTLFSIAPAIVAMIVSGLRPEVGITLWWGVCLGSVVVALLMVLLYAWLVQRVEAQRLQRLLSYLQLVVSIVIYGGYALLPRLVQRGDLGSLQQHHSWALLVYPPYWYASYMELVLGHVDAPLLIGAATGLLAVWLLARAASGRISLDFAEKLSDVSVAPARARVLQQSHEWHTSPGESRAVWLLVRAQFRSDNKFRMGVLAILPLTVLYLAMAMLNGGIMDPFTASIRGVTNDGPIYMAVIMFPILMLTSITSSDQYQASWIFFATPADRHAVLLAMQRAVFRYFVLPYLAVIGVAFLFFFHNLLHVLMHLVLLALLCNLTMRLLLLFNPKLPFSEPRLKGQRSRGFFTVALLAGIFVATGIPFAAHFVYISARRTAIALAVLWLLVLAIERLSRLRVKRLMLESEFTG